MHKLIGRTQAEEGFVMIIALVVVVIVVLLGAALISSSTTTGTHATHEYGRSDALAAADAGLEAAVHRLSSQGEESAVQEADCFTTEFVAATSGVCAATGKETMPNGASYKYYVSPVLSELGNECTGLWVSASALPGRTVTQRCITAIGTAEDKVQARVEERVANVKGSLFPVNGVFSYTSLTFINKVKLVGNTEVGARGTVKFNNTLEKEGHTLSAKYGEKLEGCTGCIETKLTAEQLANEYPLPEQSAVPYEESEKTNNDRNITFAPAGSGNEITTHREFDAVEPTITIPSGTYNFCSIYIKNKATIEYTPPVIIYIDSPNRSTMACPKENPTAKKENGTVELVNTVHFVDKAATPSASDLRFFAWGKPKETACKGAPIFQFTNDVTGPVYMEIYAPYSYVHFTNQGQIRGAVAGGCVEFTNQLEFGGELTGAEERQTGKTFYPTAYHQCAPSYEETKASKGCY